MGGYHPAEFLQHQDNERVGLPPLSRMTNRLNTVSISSQPHHLDNHVDVYQWKSASREMAQIASKCSLPATAEAIASAKWIPDLHSDKEQTIRLYFFHGETCYARSHLRLCGHNTSDAQTATPLMLAKTASRVLENAGDFWGDTMDSGQC